MNQCDGCMSGLLLDDDGMHRAASGHPVMLCQAHKYASDTDGKEVVSKSLAEQLRQYKGD